MLYERGAGDDQREAARLFGRLARDPQAPRSMRLHALLRVGDEARGRLVTGNPSAAVLAVASPVAVLLWTRGGRTEPEAAATAYRALQQLALRLGERLAAVVPAAGRRPLAVLLQNAARLGSMSIGLTSNGNAAGLARQHQCALLVIAALLQHHLVPDEVLAQLETLRAAYLNGDDLPGAGNCLVTQGLAELVRGDPEGARTRLAQARDLYAESRTGPPNPAGMASALAAERLINRFG